MAGDQKPITDSQDYKRLEFVVQAFHQFPVSSKACPVLDTERRSLAPLSEEGIEHTSESAIGGSWL